MASIEESYQNLPLYKLHAMRGSYPEGNHYRGILEKVIAEKEAQLSHEDKMLEWHKYLTDAVRSALFSYWTAILTFNGIIAAIFASSLFTSGTKDLLSSILIIASLISSFLIIINFNRQVEFQRSLDPKDSRELGSKEVENDIQRSLKRNRNTIHREHICEGIFVIQLIIITIKVIA